MAASNNPELARLLANLNAYQHVSNSVGHVGIQQPNLTRSNPFPQNQNSHEYHSVIPGLGGLPHESLPAQTPAVGFRISQPHDAKSLTSRQGQSDPKRLASTTAASHPDRPPTSSPVPAPDPSNITTWPAALKHVTKHLLPDAAVGARVKHLISSQHAHEREWYAAREAIIARQNGRQGTKAQVSALLKSLGGKDTMSDKSTAADEMTSQLENERELSTYDAKVYKGMLEMAGDFDRQLRKLRVPFFAIKWELVILEAGPEKVDASGRIRIDKGELRELQGRMMQLLEDLFAD